MIEDVPTIFPVIKYLPIIYAWNIPFSGISADQQLTPHQSSSMRVGRLILPTQHSDSFIATVRCFLHRVIKLVWELNSPHNSKNENQKNKSKNTNSLKDPPLSRPNITHIKRQGNKRTSLENEYST